MLNLSDYIFSRYLEIRTLSLLLMNKVLIIGGNGFLGGAIVNRLVKNKNFELFVTYRTKKNSRFFLENLDKLTNSFMLDVNNFEKVKNLMSDLKPNIIIDLTSLVDVNKSIDYPKGSFESSALTTLNILEAAREERIETVYINHSSDKVYNNNTLPFSEEMNLSPKDIYAVGKLTQELIANAYYFHYGIKNINIRSANYYGPYDFDLDRIIPYLMKSFIENTNISIRTNLQFKRDFLFVEEAANVNELICNHILNKQFSNFGESFNFSQEKNYSIAEIINIMTTISGNYPNVSANESNSEFEVRELLLDCSKSKKILNWENTISFEDGLSQTYNFFNNFLSN